MFELKWVEFTDPFNAWNVDESSVQWFKCLSRGVKLFSKFREVYIPLLESKQIQDDL